MSKLFSRRLNLKYFNLVLAVVYIGFAIFYAVKYYQYRQWWYLFDTIWFFLLAMWFLVLVRRLPWRSRPRKSRSLKSPLLSQSLSPTGSPTTMVSPTSTPSTSPSQSRSRFRLDLGQGERSATGKRKLPSPVIGFRIWALHAEAHRRVISWALYPMNMTYGEWVPGINTAVCLTNGERHHPAEVECGCGFWIKDSYQGAARYRGNILMVMGVAMGWGRVQAHADGWRCEFASPLAIALAPEQVDIKLESLSCTIGDIVKQMSLRYDIPMVEQRDLERWYLDNTVPQEKKK